MHCTSPSSRSSMQSLRIVVGMGLRLHDFDGERMITSRTSSSVHALKFESYVTAVGRIDATQTGVVDREQFR